MLLIKSWFRCKRHQTLVMSGKVCGTCEAERKQSEESGKPVVFGPIRGERKEIPENDK